jgi:MFS family permease
VEGTDDGDLEFQMTTRGSPVQRLWQRRLDHYPSTRPRLAYLGIIVLATIVVYYDLYVVGAVAPSIIQQYGMSFRYFVDVEVFAAAAGALSSLLAGASDRYGRANLVTYGLLVSGVLTAFAVPNAGNETVFMALVILVGFVEGIILVATPAMVRDFSPQLGRAVAMGFWTLGPVVGSLVVAAVTSNTLPANLGVHPEAWKGQFVTAGVTCLGVFVIALLFLRELSPNLRDQLMVSARDRALVEAKAANIDVEAGLRHPWRQMLHLDVIGSSFAISAFLLIYYAAVFFFVVYFTTTFGFTEKQANGIADWFWACDAGALIVVGVLSDRLRVRKPFMVLGAVGAIVMTIIFLSKTADTHTGYYSFVWIVSLLALFLGIAYGPWMAGFTETVERRNPALTATGLAVWGWILRVVVAVSAFVLPFVVSTATPLVTYGPTAQAIAAQFPREIQTIQAINPRVLDALAANSSDAAAAATALTEIRGAFKVSPSAAVTRLLALKTLPKTDLSFLQAHGVALSAAQKSNPSEWRRWWWVCVVGELVFLPLIFIMAGRWSPTSAKRDAEEHHERVSAELAKLTEGSAAPSLSVS